MQDLNEFRKYGHQFIDWIAGYYENIEQYPVKSLVQPGDIFNQFPIDPPLNGESMDDIFSDFQQIILPGITHWQNPNFFAYFPANSSLPSLLAEMLTSALGAQCMKWDTSPAAAELEEKVMIWLRNMIGLPENFQGVIQDTASTATLCAILSAREKSTGFNVNEAGLDNQSPMRIYCSSEAHSSVERAVKIAGLGRQNLVKIEVDEQFRLQPEMLEKAIVSDLESNKKPLCVVATIGTTGSTAIDPLKEIAAICKKYKIWLHVDAAYAGSALILPEYRWMIDGIEHVDSFVFNPHKWLFTNFDCSAYFVKDKNILINTFAILPEYLRTQHQGKVNDYCDWGIQLGRRFRALKLWFVIRNFGIKGLQDKIRLHLSLAQEFAKNVSNDENFEILTPLTLNLVCFRFKPCEISDTNVLNELNEKLLHSINRTGKMYMTHTKLNGLFTLRLVIAQTNVEKKHVDEAWKIIKEKAAFEMADS
jgi:aromatic-L-amino-acid decarboxylase